jgi:hypothetical protein
VAHVIPLDGQRLPLVMVLKASHRLLSNGQARVHGGASIELLLIFFLFFSVLSILALDFVLALLKKKLNMSYQFVFVLILLIVFLIVICFVFNAL